MKPKILIASFLVTLGIFGGYFFPFTKPLSTGQALPQVVALFETSLASPISTSATSMTLTANAVRGGGVLSGFNCFTVDEGSAQAEFICGTVSGTTVSSLTRGIDPATGTSTVASLKFAHRRGANVKITDFPTITIIRNQLSGIESISSSSPIKYDSSFTPTLGSYVVAPWDYIKTYADGLSFAGVATATEGVNGGLAWLGTALQQASSTNGGANQPFVMQTRYATDTPTSGCAVGYTGTAGAGCSVIATLTGKIKQTFLDIFSTVNTWTGTNTFTATTTMATTTSTNLIGKNFGGTGLDGELSVSSGTTTINLGGAAVVEKNYTSVSITGTGAIAFSNPAAGGSIVILRSQGNFVHTSSGQISLVDIGSSGGSAGSVADADNTQDGGSGGGGGASMIAAGSPGTDSVDGNNSAQDGTAGSGFSKWLYSQTAITGGGGGTSGGGPASISPAIDTTYMKTYLRWLVLPGSGGGGGESGDTAGNVARPGSNGARGGGALYVEVGGGLNITGTINASGSTSPAVSDSLGGCGGGGGGGSIQILYNYLIANSGTYNVSGGLSGATCTAPGGTGATGYSSVTKNFYF